VTQNDHISVGDIIGSDAVAIGQGAKANVTWIENQKFYNANEIEEIDSDSIKYYLAQVQQPFTPPSDATKIMKIFFGLDFYTHKLGDINI